MAIMREMVEAATAAQIRTESQALEMAKISMQGAVGVAEGAGGGKASAAPGKPAAAAVEMIDCPKCSTSAPATSKFCMKCGHKLRT